MRLASQDKKIHGAKVFRLAPPITHLMLADDCIPFEDVSNQMVNVLKEILGEYESCSGQCVNYEKSTVFFSTNVKDQDKSRVFQALHVRSSTDLESYLRLPNVVGRKKKMIFHKLKDRLMQKINN